MPDTPQTIQTTHSLLAHTLTASLHPVELSAQPLRKSLTVHTKRYASSSSVIPPAPETHSFREPTKVEVQVPRTIFTSGEDIPLYVTVPPPTREIVVDKGLRLRNIQAELVRVIKVKREQDEEDAGDFDSDLEEAHPGATPTAESSHASQSADSNTHSSSTKPPSSPLFLGSSYRRVIARSGASCRFHSSRPIRLRFILHQTLLSTPSESRTSLAAPEAGRMESDAESALITQVTLLHTVSFHIRVYVSFVDTTTHTERLSNIIIPIVIRAPAAPLPQVPPTIDEAYSKKHDRPPTRTNRHEEDLSIPHYSEAGPSMLSGAPPPFDDREAPPPFFATELEASTSSRLPTFQESENEIILPDPDPSMALPPAVFPSIPGEGDIFGFPASQQFDGHSEDMQRSDTPPPSLEMASHDPDLTSLADLHDPAHVAIEAMNLVLESRGEAELVGGEQPPPPPPAMDDPSDPPPSIDSAFRTPEAMGQQRPATPPLPPYLVPEHDAHHHHHQEHVNVVRPPPYVD
ncbi:hypothetical protein MD484_g1398, partial [Candolleomyces efflorescens]